MLLDTYKEFNLAEKVRVKKETIHNFLMSAFMGLTGTHQVPVIEYVMRKENLLTIAEIEYNPSLIIQAYFSFRECDGQLHYGQIKKCFPVFYMLGPNDFKD